MISKKKLTQINIADFIYQTLEEHKTYKESDWWKENPELWDADQKREFDMLAFIQDRMKEKIIEILTN